MNTETQKLIAEAKNICVIPAQNNEPESMVCALALFYTLKQSGKNVNLLCEEFPEKLQFLIPSVDFLSQPKNFVISIPRAVADVSQIYYEKSEEHLKIHLTTESSRIKKDAISFYFEQPKPDLVIALGIADFEHELSKSLDSFGFLLGAPLINIDNNPDNKKFGTVNILQEKSLSEMLLEIIDTQAINKETANCLLAAMMIHYENFKSAGTNPQVLKTAAGLMEQGASHQQIADNLYKTTATHVAFLSQIFKNLANENGRYVAQINTPEFSRFGQTEAAEAAEKINQLQMQQDVLVLWKTDLPTTPIAGFFCSKNTQALAKINSKHKNHWAFLQLDQPDTAAAKEYILRLMF